MEWLKNNPVVSKIKQFLAEYLWKSFHQIQFVLENEMIDT